MTTADFEDPRELARCIRSDCGRYRLNKDIPFCVFHLREQETSSPGLIEPEVEARVARIRTEDDEHPGEKKIWNDDGTSEWVPDPDWRPPAPRVYMGPDPDTVEPGPESFTVVRPGSIPGTERPAGCWVAYHSDWSGLALFDDELEALRHAVSNSMTVGWAAFGQELGGGRYPGQRPSLDREGTTL